MNSAHADPDATLAIDGKLDLAGVSRLARDRAIARRIDATPADSILRIDLGGVERTSSAAVALMLDWLARARMRGVALRFDHVPPALARIAALSNVDGLLGIAAPGAVSSPGSSDAPTDPATEGRHPDHG